MGTGPWVDPLVFKLSTFKVCHKPRTRAREILRAFSGFHVSSDLFQALRPVVYRLLAPSLLGCYVNSEVQGVSRVGANAMISRVRQNPTWIFVRDAG